MIIGPFHSPNWKTCKISIKIPRRATDVKAIWFILGRGGQLLRRTSLQNTYLGFHVMFYIIFRILQIPCYSACWMRNETTRRTPEFLIVCIWVWVNVERRSCIIYQCQFKRKALCTSCGRELTSREGKVGLDSLWSQMVVDHLPFTSYRIMNNEF